MSGANGKSGKVICRGAVRAGDAGLGQCFVDRHGQYACPHRNLQQFTSEPVQDTVEGLFQIVGILLSAHVPHQTADHPPRQSEAGDHATVEDGVFSQGAVGILDFIVTVQL